MSCPFQIRTLLNSFTQIVSTAFSLITIPRRFAFTSQFTMTLAEKTCVVAITSIYTTGTIIASPPYVLLFTVSTTNSVSLMRLYVLSSLISRDTLIFCRCGWPKLIGEDEQCMFILFYSIRIWNRNVKQYVLCLFYSCYEMRYILLLFYFIMFHSIWWLLKSVLFC